MANISSLTLLRKNPCPRNVLEFCFVLFFFSLSLRICFFILGDAGETNVLEARG